MCNRHVGQDVFSTFRKVYSVSFIKELKFSAQVFLHWDIYTVPPSVYTHIHTSYYSNHLLLTIIRYILSLNSA